MAYRGHKDKSCRDYVSYETLVIYACRLQKSRIILVSIQICGNPRDTGGKSDRRSWQGIS